MASSFSPEAGTDLVGLTGAAERVVGEADTAIAHGSGDLPVLATPSLVALMESAACEALRGHLPHATTSVGTHIDVRHVAPSAIGAAVTAHALVTSVTGTRVTFDVRATHDAGDRSVEIGRGVHTRVVVDRERFVHAL